MAESQIRHCKNCGKGFELVSGQPGRRPRHCSDACRLGYQRRLSKARWDAGIRSASQPIAKRLKAPTPCLHCEADTTRPKYCSSKCSQVARGRRNGVRLWEDYVAEARQAALRRECPECRGLFQPTRHDRHSAGPQVYCSRTCLHAEGNRHAVKKEAVRAEAAVYRRWAKDARQRLLEAQAERLCPDCGQSLGRWQRRCGQCRDARKVAVQAKLRRIRRRTPAHKAARRAAKAARRAIERGIDAERFDPFEIFERDGWRCHICTRVTPKRYRGSYKPNAPELDHIVPLAKGGKHTRANVACSCRECNGKKADRILGQPSLLAFAA